MDPLKKPTEYHPLERVSPDDTFALDILAGLSEPRRAIPSQYLYDDEGSRLFVEITRLPEYYLTACERDALAANTHRIARYVRNGPFNLVEFGPGDGHKTSILIDHFRTQRFDFCYVPIDISTSAIASLSPALQRDFPGLEVTPLVSEYFPGIRSLSRKSRRRNLVLFLGSSIGNFTPAQARLFLRHLWLNLNHGDILLIGFDLMKDIDLLLHAYNDSEGVTAAFNLNLLARINRDLDGFFSLPQFRHYGTYNPAAGAMESYLISLTRQEVHVGALRRTFSFRAWEPVHTEFSHKYLESDIDALALDTAFVVREHLYDSKRWFVDSVWEVRKSGPDGHR